MSASPTRSNLSTTSNFRWSRAIVLLLAVVALGPWFSGCGGGGDDEGGKGSVSDGLVDDLRAEAETAMNKAKKAGAEQYAPRDWGRAVSRWESAEEAYAEGDKNTAAKRFKPLEGKFKKVLSAAKKGKKDHDKAVTEKNRYLAAKKTIDEKKIGEGNASWQATIEAASDNFSTGEEQLSEGKFSAATKKFRIAAGDLASLVETFNKSLGQEEKVENLKKRMAEAKQRAMDAGADQVEAATWALETAARLETDGDDAYTNQNWATAAYSYERAAEAYNDAIRHKKQAEDAAAAIASAEGSYDEDSAVVRERAPELDEIDLPDYTGGDDPSSVSGSIESLFSVDPNYEDGIVRLDYSSGAFLKQDCTYTARKITGGKRTLAFEGREGVGSIGEVEEDEEDLDAPAEIIYSFAGNTRGLLRLNASFDDLVSMEFDVNFQLVLPNSPMFRFMVNSNKKGTSYYGSDFGYKLVLAEDKRATKDSVTRNFRPEFKKAVQLWVKKTEAYNFKILYRKNSDDEKGTLAVWMNGEEMFRQKTDKWRKGYPGFQWNNVKFVVTNLLVKGRLDEEWAKEALEKQGEKSGGGSDDSDDEDELDF